jgi:hypothetical protein
VPLGDPRQHDEDAVAAPDPVRGEEVGRSVRGAGQVAERESPRVGAGGVDREERQPVGLARGAGIDDISRVVETLGYLEAERRPDGLVAVMFGATSAMARSFLGAEGAPSPSDRKARRGAVGGD